MVVISQPLLSKFYLLVEISRIFLALNNLCCFKIRWNLNEKSTQNDRIWASHPWCWKRPLCQVSQNHCPRLSGVETKQLKFFSHDSFWTVDPKLHWNFGWLKCMICPLPMSAIRIYLEVRFLLQFNTRKGGLKVTEFDQHRRFSENLFWQLQQELECSYKLHNILILVAYFLGLSFFK